MSFEDENPFFHQMNRAGVGSESAEVLSSSACIGASLFLLFALVRRDAKQDGGDFVAAVRFV